MMKGTPKKALKSKLLFKKILTSAYTNLFLKIVAKFLLQRFSLEVVP